MASSSTYGAFSELPPGEYSGFGIIVCASIFIAIQTLVVGLRLYTRYITKTVWGWDDCMLVPALLSAVMLDATYIYMVQYCGLGYHELPLLFDDPDKVVMFAKLTLLTTTAITLALMFPRYCTYFIYLRIFTSKTLRTLTLVLFAISVFYGVLGLILNFTVCIPISATWTPGLKAQCFDRKAWWSYGTIPVSLFDVATMALPVSTIMRLSVPLGERVALLLTFLAYGFGTIAEIVRIVIVTTMDGTADATWTDVPLTYATMCEVGTYVIAACIPGLRPLHLYVRGKGSYSRKDLKPDQYGKPPLRYINGYQMDSHEQAPSSTAIGNCKSGRSKDPYHQFQSDESLFMKDRIKITSEIIVA